MNKSLCKEIKKRGKFKRIMCSDCSYLNRCIDWEEDKNGHNEELREMTNDAQGETKEAGKDSV